MQGTLLDGKNGTNEGDSQVHETILESTESIEGAN
jgi:hypothetical protein